MIKNSIITGDIHCANWKPFSVPLSTGINSRMQNCLDVLTEIFNYASCKNVSNIFILGDLFHVRGRIETTVYDTVFSFFRERADQNFNIYLLVGNHDQAIKSGEIHALNPFKMLKNVTVIDTPTQIDNTLCYPYSEHIDTDFISKSDAEYLLGHFGVSGAVIGASNYIIGEQVSLKTLRNYKKVFLNHFHKHQILGNIYLPGSPLQHTFGERDEVKGFFFVDNNYNPTFVETVAPKFKLVEVSDPKDVLHIDNKDYLQFVIKSKKVKNFDFSAISDTCKVSIDLPKAFEERLEIKTEETDIQILENYIQKFREAIINQGLNLEKASHLGKKIWEEYEKRAATEDKVR